MSLLLKALQRASKSRESLPRRTTGPLGATATSSLEIEPGDIEPPRPARRALDFGSGHATAGSGVGGASKSTGRAADAIEWAREHPVHIFAAGALVFLAGYFVYVYLAINHPGLFTRSSPQAPIAQPEAPRPVTPPRPNAPVAEAPPAPPSALVPDLKIPADPAQPASRDGVAASSLPPLPTPAADPQPPLDAQAAAAPLPRAPASPAAASVPASAPASIDDAPPRPVATAARPRRIRAAPSVADKADRPRAAERPLEEGVQVRATAAGDHAATRTSEGWEALQRHDFAKAQSSYEAALAADPRNIDALLGLAATAWQQGRPDVASEQYYRVLQLDPQNAQAQSGLIGLAGQVDPQASESRLKQLISHDPSAFLYASLGHLYAGQAQWSQAQQAYFQAYQLESANPDYAYNLAVGLEHLGQRGIALGYYRKALDLARARGRAGFDQAQVAARVAKLAAPTE